MTTQPPKDNKETLAPDEYRCAMCHKVYKKGWSDEEAMAETNSYWDGTKQEDCEVVCDDCWQKIHPMKNIETYLSTK